ncbi:TonB-dependent receptor [Sphingomonas sp. G-3-2-10]|uniref:TonB-dependent receptor n=1 Tax=Sphingomonas sp. G-3-2-10 TaxID=2728838 RepID=UPI001F0EA3AA|nr:TonB-dependent receptor [Sphingomonas sp. G-3-2-10]
MRDFLRNLGNGASQAALIVGLVAMPTIAYAQSAEEPVQAPVDEAEPDNGEIVVTAQKRSERLVDVPLAVTAVSGETLAGAQVNDTASLTRAVPSLTFQQGNNPGNSSLRIRGVGTQLFSQGVESAVSVVVDGVVAPRQAQGLSDLSDLERIEVLRGPQGTLFGKNATAGVVNIVTARPSDQFGGSAEVTVAEQGEYRFRGSLTGPISSTLKARVSGFYNNVDGHLNNIAKNVDGNGYESWGVRAKLDWEAAPNLNFLLIGDYRITNSNCCSRVPVSIVNPAMQTLLGPIVASPKNRDISNDDGSFTRIKGTTVSLQGDWDLGFGTVTSITAWQYYRQNDSFEPDGIFSNPVRYVGAFPYSAWNFNNTNMHYGNFTQELRLSSNGSSDFTYVVGGFYSHLDLDREYNRRRERCATGTIGQVCTVPLTADSSGFNGNFKSDNYALFGQVDWRVAGGLHLIGGLRGTYEKQTVTGRVYGPLQTGDTLFPGTVINQGTRSRDDSAVTGRAGLRYEFDRNFQVYGTYTRGYKAFALDIDATTRFDNQVGIAPEHVNGYELGVKWVAPGRKFDINAALFRSDFTNLQVQALLTDPVAGTFQTVLQNAGKSRSQGFEAEMNFRPTRGLSIAANFTLVDATIDVPGQSCPLQVASTGTFASNFPVNTCYVRSTTVGGVTTLSGAITDVVGGQLPATPRYRVGVTPRYEHEFGSFGGFVQVSLNYQSDVSFALNQDPLLKQDGYAIVDASVGINTLDNRYALTFFVRNLFDQTYYSQLNHGTILANAANPRDLWANINKDADRYVGGTFKVRF